MGFQVLHFMKNYCFKTEIPVEEKPPHKVNPIPELRNHGAPPWWNVQLGLDFGGINSPQAGLAPARGSAQVKVLLQEEIFSPRGPQHEGPAVDGTRPRLHCRPGGRMKGKKSRKHVWPKITEIT